MLTAINVRRRIGKTTYVILLLMENKNSILVVPSRMHLRQIPKALHYRVIVACNKEDLELKLAGRHYDVIIFDEGFAYSKVDIAEIYYFLGKMGAKTVSIGTA